MNRLIIGGVIGMNKGDFFKKNSNLDPHATATCNKFSPLQWRHNGRDGVSNHQPDHCLLDNLFRRRSKKTSNIRVTGLCVENSPVTGEFPAQMVSNAENVSNWWRQHDENILVIVNGKGDKYYREQVAITCWFHSVVDINVQTIYGT